MLSNPIDPEKTFLTIDNGTQVPENQSIEDGQLEIDIKYVNCTLSDLGLDAPFPFVEQPCSPSTLYRTRSAVTTLIRLLSARKRDEAYRNDTDERFKKLEEEIEVGRQTLERCFSRLQASEAELRMVQEESRCRAVRLSEMENILKLTSDECSRLRNAFLTKERQFTTEIRKKDLAFEKLRDQLQSVLKEPSSLISLAARVENTIHDKIAVENDSSAIAFRTPSSTADRCEMLEHENSNLRQLIASISSILCDLSRNVIPIEDENVSIEEMTELPITWVYDRIKAQIETCLNVLSDHILP